MIQRPEPTLERLHAQAASGVSGAKRAQQEIRLATLRGLAAATGRPMPIGRP